MKQVVDCIPQQPMETNWRLSLSLSSVHIVPLSLSEQPSPLWLNQRLFTSRNNPPPTWPTIRYD